MSRDLPEGSNTGEEPVVSRRRATGRLDDDNLAQEDMDEQEINVNLSSSGRLMDDELLSFVNVYFANEFMAHDAYHVKHSTNPELNRNGSRVVWVENTQTGDMIPVVRRNTGASRTSARRRGTSSGGGGAETGADAEGRDDGEQDDLLDLERGSGGAGKDAYSSLLLSVPPMPPPLDEEALVGSGGLKGSPGATLSSSAAAAHTQKQEEEIAPIVSYHNLVMVQRAIFLVFQGLQAGFCFTTLFTVQASGGSNERLLEFYQPNAGDYRRFFYILSTISLVGSVDLCLTVLNSRAESLSSSGGGAQQHQTYSNTYHRALQALRLNYDPSSVLLSLLIALLYAVAFMMSLLMSSFDVLAMVRDGLADTTQWPVLALEDSLFSTSLENWKAFNNLRVICSVSAWIGSCLFVWKDLIQLNSKSADLFRLRETTVAWSNRVREMEGGAGLDQLRPAALKRLMSILKVGLDRARDALSFYEQEREQTQQQQQQQALGGTALSASNASAAFVSGTAGARAVPLEMEMETLLSK